MTIEERSVCMPHIVVKTSCVARRALHLATCSRARSAPSPPTPRVRVSASLGQDTRPRARSRVPRAERRRDRLGDTSLVRHWTILSVVNYGHELHIGHHPLHASHSSHVTSAGALGHRSSDVLWAKRERQACMGTTRGDAGSGDGGGDGGGGVCGGILGGCGSGGGGSGGGEDAT